MIPRNPVDNFVSCIDTLSLVPLRTVGFEFMSSTAASMATLATLPMVELKDKIAPMLTVLGLAETLLIPFEGKPWHWQNTMRTRSQILYMLCCTARMKQRVKKNTHTPL